VDETREPGIRMTGVVVERVRFDDIKVGEQRPRSLRYVYRIERRPFEEEGLAEVALHHSIRTASVDDQPDVSFALDLTVAARFEADEGSEMTLGDFLRFNGPAQLVPFVREMVANLSARSRHGLILLPSVNIIALVRRDEAAAAAKLEGETGE
jgi:preprotein translocase subunit SecB